MNETLKEKVTKLIEKYENMTIDELEAMFIESGYTPQRRPEFKKDEE